MLRRLMHWLLGKPPETSASEDFRAVLLESAEDRILDQVRKRVEDIRRLAEEDIQHLADDYDHDGRLIERRRWRRT